MPPTNADYAKINIACKELNIDKHQLLGDRYGVESSKELNRAQLQDLYNHFHVLGWRVKRKASGRTSPRYSDRAQRKVVALWITLHKEGVIRNGSDLALQAYVKRMTGIANLKWCDGGHCFVLIEALKGWALREGVDVN